MDINSRITLNNGIQMPYFGLGVYQTGSGNPTQNAVKWALDAGYRLIDTAKMYGNEADVGTAIRVSDIPRNEIFVTTKLWTNDHGYDNAMKAFNRSLERLNVEYIDLFLIHWPGSSKRKKTWQALETLVKEKTCKAIGVSNYTIYHLNELFEYASVTPAVNQVEFNPFLYQKELLDYCNEHNIQLEAYSPLSKGRKLHDKKLQEIAKKYSKSTAQILIRWGLQHKIIVIPKSSNKERIEQNADVFDFDISDEDMKVLNSFNDNYRAAWDPTDIK